MKPIFASTVLGLSIICRLSNCFAVSFDWAIIGNPGNAGDTEIRYDGATNSGAVGYVYRISKHEVTNAQYTEFLNSVDPNGTNSLALYKEDMASDDRGGGILFDGSAENGFKYRIKTDRGNNPVNYASFFDAMRFVNWLENGQGTGSTESGVYSISDGLSEVRATSVRYFIPSNDEWYKAAYHKNDGVTGNYKDYPTGTDLEPYSDDPASLNTPDNTNVANINKDDGEANGYDEGYAVAGPFFWPPQNVLTNVGAYSLSASPYGTFDQGGNVSEWNEEIFLDPQTVIGRGFLGGSWRYGPSHSAASSRGIGTTNLEFNQLGFRVAGTVPEPTTLAFAIVALCLALPRRDLVRRSRQGY